MSAIRAFDTLAFVKRLIAVGVRPEQAEVQAELQAQILSELVTDKLVTKEDLSHSETNLRQDIATMETSLRQEIAGVKAETKQLEAKVDKMDEKISGKFNLLSWMLGFTLTAVMALLFKSF
jgi:hypothetical protein